MIELKIPLNTFKISSPFVGTVLENKKLTADASPNDTRHIVIDLSKNLASLSSSMSYEYLEGQSVGILPPGVDEKGKPYTVRLYSIASSREGEAGFSKSISICVKRVLYQDPVTGSEIRGVASNFICDLKNGDRVSLTGPAGRNFLLPDAYEPFNYIFIATGTGIAPFRSMLKRLFLESYQGVVWLIFGIPYSTDLLYDSEFKAYENDNTFHYVTAISREQKNPDGTKVYVQHRLLEHQDVIVPLLLQSNTLMYICGLKGMEKGIEESCRKMLPQYQYDEVKKRIRVEVY